MKFLQICLMRKTFCRLKIKMKNCPVDRIMRPLTNPVVMFFELFYKNHNQDLNYIFGGAIKLLYHLNCQNHKGPVNVTISIC